ncbi:MAG: class II aldolase/adducin family protein [Thermodesulfobacteriota bacterium]
MHEFKILAATCCRLLEANALIDFSGHVSCRVSEDLFLINSHGKSRLEVEPEDIVPAKMDATPLEAGTRLPSEAHIHSSIYRVRRDVLAVAHLHSPAVVSLSIARQPIFPAIFQGTLFADGIPIYEDARHVNTADRGNRLAMALGNAKVIVIRGHGSVVVAKSVKELFFLSIYFEKNAQRLLEAYRAGSPEPLSAEVQEEGRTILMKESIMNKVWDYYVSKLPK